MNIFKPAKQERGDFTVIIEIKGEPKMYDGKAVYEEIEVGKDNVTGEAIIEKKQVFYAYSAMKINKNYPEGEQPKEWKDRESYMLFSSNYVGEKDWVGKDKETKKVYAEFDFLEGENKFVGHVMNKKLEIPVSDINSRIFQGYLVNEDELANAPF